MSDDNMTKKVRFKTQEIAQAFIDKLRKDDKDLFIPAPFGKKPDSAEYWGVAIVATNREEELEGYGKFIDNCRRMGIRPRFVFLNRIDSKLIKDDKIEDIGVPWMAPEEAEEKPIDILEPIEDEDIDAGEPDSAKEPNISGTDFSKDAADKVEPAESADDLVQEEGWVRDFLHDTGQPIHEEVIPIDSVRLNKSGAPDGRFSSVKRMLKDRESVRNINFIDVSQGNGEEFVYAFQQYAEQNGLKDGEDFIIVKDDYVVITNQKLTSDVLDLMNQFGVSFYDEAQEEMEDEVYDEIDEVSDIPDLM